MIPPEPEPVPPVPTPVGTYSYQYTSQFRIGGGGGLLANLYTSIRDEHNNSAAYLSGTVNDEPVTFSNLIIWTNVLDEEIVGFASENVNGIRYLVSSVNSEMGLTVPLYQIDFNNDNAFTQTEDVVYVSSSTPSDYYANLKNGDYTLQRRS